MVYESFFAVAMVFESFPIMKIIFYHWITLLVTWYSSELRPLLDDIHLPFLAYRYPYSSLYIAPLLLYLYSAIESILPNIPHPSTMSSQLEENLLPSCEQQTNPSTIIRYLWGRNPYPPHACPRRIALGMRKTRCPSLRLTNLRLYIKILTKVALKASKHGLETQAKLLCCKN
jgi:hypothetical protein